jgi:adenosylmethionine-8-amino-7-oxononanoate aminotransferase
MEKSKLKQYDASDVQNILTAFAEEFSVDIPAVHDGKGGYLIEFNTLNGELILGSHDWYAAIAGYTNEKIAAALV